MSAAFVGKISEHFEDITDPRLNRGTNYPLIEMVFVGVVRRDLRLQLVGRCRIVW